MALNYTKTHCIVTDDVGNRPALTFSLGQKAEIDAAAIAYSMPLNPEPDWLGFAGWLYVFPPIADAMAAARASTTAQGEPATTGLATAMQEARLSQNYPAWQATWGQFLLASDMAPEPLGQIVARAAECNLPAEFIATLAPLEFAEQS